MVAKVLQSLQKIFRAKRSHQIYAISARFLIFCCFYRRCRDLPVESSPAHFITAGTTTIIHVIIIDNHMVVSSPSFVREQSTRIHCLNCDCCCCLRSTVCRCTITLFMVCTPTGAGEVDRRLRPSIMLLCRLSLRNLLRREWKYAPHHGYRTGPLWVVFDSSYTLSTDGVPCATHRFTMHVTMCLYAYV
ncbi:unnamed protein product [Ectocarpus sp. 12 AP-2014]